MSRDSHVRSASRFGKPVLTTMALAIVLVSAAGPACNEEGIGDPCIPEQEYNADFLGFDAKEVNVESKSFQCRTRLCLVNHFQGRVSCPYGQDDTGKAPTNTPAPNANGCVVPGTTEKIEGAKDSAGNFIDDRNKSRVPRQCVDRAAANAVYCSCRCGDINGERPSGQSFCDCPDGFECKRLVTSIGQGNEGLTGSYCIKTNTQFDQNTACSRGECDPNDDQRKCN